MIFPILTSCGGGGGGGGGAQVTTTPADIVISFGAANYAKTEDDSAFNIPVTLSAQPLSPPLTLRITPDGTAQDMGTDYTLSGDYASRAVMFNTDETAKNINVSITDDSAAEGEESFTLALPDPDDLPPGYAYGQRTTIVTITDNEYTAVSFSTGPLDVMVGDMAAEIFLNLADAADGDEIFTIESSSFSKVGLSSSRTDTFSVSVDVTVLNGQQTSAPFYVQGFEGGMATLEIVTLPSDIALGFPRRDVTVTVTEP